MKTKLIKFGAVIAVVIVLLTMTVIPTFAWTDANKNVEIVETSTYPTTFAQNTVYKYTQKLVDNEWGGWWQLNDTLVNIPAIEHTYDFDFKVYGENIVYNYVVMSLGGVVYYNDVRVYGSSADTWVNSKYKLIYVISEPPVAMLNWLKANGTRTNPSTSSKTSYIVKLSDGSIETFDTLTEAVIALFTGDAQDYIDATINANPTLNSGIETLIDDYGNLKYQEGYNVGYDKGVNATGSEAFGHNLLGETLNAPLNALNQFVIYQNGDVVITLGLVVGSMLALLVLIAFLKLFAGG